MKTILDLRKWYMDYKYLVIFVQIVQAITFRKNMNNLKKFELKNIKN